MSGEAMVPCPFCGEQPTSRFVGDDDGGYWAVECHHKNNFADPSVFIGVHGDDQQPAEEAWNKRWFDASSQAEIERLTRERDEALDALECADETLQTITDHDPKTPGLHFDSLEQLLESAVGIAGLRREAIAPILAARALASKAGAA